MRCRCLVKEEGFTLVEVIVVMSVFIIVLMISASVSASAFNKVLTKSKDITKSEESNIDGVVGLEMFRHDLIQAGFGLFNDLDPTIAEPTYDEVDHEPIEQ